MNSLVPPTTGLSRFFEGNRCNAEFIADEPCRTSHLLFPLKAEIKATSAFQLINPWRREVPLGVRLHSGLGSKINELMFPEQSKHGWTSHSLFSWLDANYDGSTFLSGHN